MSFTLEAFAQSYIYELVFVCVFIFYSVNFVQMPIFIGDIAVVFCSCLFFVI